MARASRLRGARSIGTRDPVRYLRTMSSAVEIPPSESRRPTYADIEALPPGLNGEIIAGELVVSPRPASPHARAGTKLTALLDSSFDIDSAGPAGWWLLYEPELSLAIEPDYDPIIPDLAGWRLETMPEFPELAQFHTCPDWICEIVLPSSARHDRVMKLPYYARAGVQHAWLVDPVAQSLEVYRREGASWLLVQTAGGDQRVRAEPFDALELSLDALWRRRPPPTPEDVESALIEDAAPGGESLIETE